ncbi:MAG: hypothetical protein HOP28_09215 [Gemmatimonadales bacterium]|nr:hypothetical protein [Gemmatimonadales bacterium]
MIRKILLTLGVLVLGAVGVTGWFYAKGAALPGQGLPPVPDQLIAAGDSAKLAEFTEARCRLLMGKKKQSCIEDVLLTLVRQDRVRLAMATLALLGERSDAIRHIGHDYSHVIGINAWEPGKDVGKSYMQCTELFQSGCYHGVIQSFFAYKGTDSASVVSVCRDTPEISASAYLRFQCVHGIGHGLVQTYSMKLPRALAGCDMLGNSWDSESCYGGAFMEFIVGGRGQSHHVTVKTDSGAAEEMDHSKMDHGAMAQDTFPSFKVREPSDLHYPCSVLGKQYQHSCYQMQAGLIVERTGLDFAKVAKVCDTAPEKMRSVCYQGMGTYISGVTTRDPVKSLQHCSLGASRYQPWCFVGAVKNFIDVTATAEDGLEFCGMVAAEDAATSCYNAIGEEAAFLYQSMDRRAVVCAKALPKYVEACRFGAGLSPIRPAALPRA